MKNIVRIIAVVLVLSMAFVGCGKTKSEGKVVIGDYKNLTVTTFDPTVTQKDIDDAIAALIAENKQEVELMNQGASAGNKVVIDFKGFVDGVALESGTATDYTIPSLCYGSFIDGFEESIVGKKAGESFTADLKFPDPYPNNPDVAGKPVTFEITVKKIFRIDIPAYNDETVSKYAGFDTTAKYEEYLKEQISNEKIEAGLMSQQNEIWEQVLAVSEVTEWPQEQVDEQVENITNYFKSYAQMFGITYADFIKNYTTLGDEAAAEKYILEEAKAAVKETLVIKTLVEENNIEYTKAEYDAFVQGVADANGMTVAAVKEAYTEEIISEAVCYEKLIALLREFAVEVEPKTEQ